MPEALRPMSTGELLDRTFALYRRNFLLFAGIVLPAPAILLVVQLAELPFAKDLAASSANPALMMANMGRMIWAIAAAALAWIVGMSITHAATVKAVSAVHLSRPISVGQSYASIKGRYLRVIAIVICLMLALMGAWIVFGMAGVLVMVAAVAGGSAVAGTLGKIAGGAVGVVAIVGAIVMVIWVMARYALAIQACVIEGTRVFESLKRSTVLAKGSILRIIVVYVLFAIMNLVIALTLQSVVKLVTVPFHSLQLSVGLQALAGFVAGVLVGPLATVAMSLVYYDERVRKEAFDLQLMMAALDGAPASAVASVTQ